MVSPKHKTPSLVVQTFTIWNEFTLLIYNIHIYILCVKTNESQTTILCIYVIKIKVMPLHKNHCSEEIHIFLGLPWKIEKTFKIKHNYCKTNKTMLVSTGSLEFYISRRDILDYFLLYTHFVLNMSRSILVSNLTEYDSSREEIVRVMYLSYSIQYWKTFSSTLDNP